MLEGGGVERTSNAAVKQHFFVSPAKGEETDEVDDDEGDQNEYQRGETWIFILFSLSQESHADEGRGPLHLQTSQPSYTKFRRPMLRNQ